jgi:hypothetical protein
MDGKGTSLYRQMEAAYTWSKAIGLANLGADKDGRNLEWTRRKSIIRAPLLSRRGTPLATYSWTPAASLG